MKGERFYVFTLILILLTGLLLAGLYPHNTIAQGPTPTPRRFTPTPTSVAPPPPPPSPSPEPQPAPEQAEKPSSPANSTVQGYVYNYSSGHPAPGIEVVISGGGWSTSTRSDSSGFYRFQGLGYGVATLNLRLPPGFTQANPDVKVFLDGRNTVEVNLGFYAGERPSWPVQLSLLQKTIFVKSGTDFEIGFEVRNTGSEVLNGIEVEVNLPDVVSLKGVSPETIAFEAGQNGIKIGIGELEPSQAIQIRLKCQIGTSPGRYTIPITVRYSRTAYTVSAVIQVETSLPKTGFTLPVGLAILLVFTIYMARYLRVDGNANERRET